MVAGSGWHGFPAGGWRVAVVCSPGSLIAVRVVGCWCGSPVPAGLLGARFRGGWRVAAPSMVGCSRCDSPWFGWGVLILSVPARGSIFPWWLLVSGCSLAGGRWWWVLSPARGGSWLAAPGCCWIAGGALSDWRVLLVWLLDWRVLSWLARALPVGCWLLVAGADSRRD